MAELIASTPCAGLLPISHGDVTLSEVDAGCLTSIAPYRGRTDALSDLLTAAHGMAFPKPGRMTGKAGARCLWVGREQAMLIGPEPDLRLAEHAALSDQSDGWAVVRLEGAGAVDVLARLVPVDLRAATFKRGHTARTLLQHVTVSITRVGPETFEILAFRSMGRTLVHDIGAAMRGVAARGDAPGVLR